MIDDGDKGYAPDPPAYGVSKYRCPKCLSVFETKARGSRMTSCRNKTCDGTPQRI